MFRTPIVWPVIAKQWITFANLISTNFFVETSVFVFYSFKFLDEMSEENNIQLLVKKIAVIFSMCVMIWLNLIKDIPDILSDIATNGLIENRGKDFYWIWTPSTEERTERTRKTLIISGFVIFY